MLSYLKGAAAAIALAALVACSQSGQPPDASSITLQEVQAQIKSTCNYAPTIASIASVAATIATAIDPAAGAGATILVATGNTVVKAICDAVQAQSGKMSGKKGGEQQTMDVVVNGVTVHGTYTASEKP
jgi:hypothetical protein